MKTEFELEYEKNQIIGCIKIIGNFPDHTPYVSIDIRNQIAYIKDKDLELFAVNILKALRSKKLK